MKFKIHKKHENTYISSLTRVSDINVKMLNSTYKNIFYHNLEFIEKTFILKNKHKSIHFVSVLFIFPLYWNE